MIFSRLSNLRISALRQLATPPPYLSLSLSLPFLSLSTPSPPPPRMWLVTADEGDACAEGDSRQAKAWLGWRFSRLVIYGNRPFESPVSSPAI